MTTALEPPVPGAPDRTPGTGPPLTRFGNVVLLPGVTETVTAPRRHRALWRQPWWWRPLRYWLSPSYTSVRARLEALEKAYAALAGDGFAGCPA
jgi:hypothetical protein